MSACQNSPHVRTAPMSEQPPCQNSPHVRTAPLISDGHVKRGTRCRCLGLTAWKKDCFSSTLGPFSLSCLDQLEHRRNRQSQLPCNGSNTQAPSARVSARESLLVPINRQYGR